MDSRERVERMITNELHVRAARIERAKEALEKALRARVVEIARRMHLDEVWYGDYSNRYIRGGKEVVSKQLNELETFYGDHIHDCGWTALWTRERGWVA
jgi:hypothetical protein